MNDTETKPDIEAKPETKAKAWLRPKREKTIAERRSLVRVWVTKMAALYIFLGSAALIIGFWIFNPDDTRVNA